MPIKEIPKQLVSVRTALIAVIAVTIITFLPTFQNGYVFWDDPEYILHNPLMTAPLRLIFFGGSASYYLDNYHPLTILVYTFEHQFFGSSMMGYHAISLLLHVLNSLLVFLFAYLLFGKRNTLIPLVTSLLFAVHPMHVESVAWASELKDVLYTFFFLASLVCYVYYIQKGKQLKYLGLSLLLFLLSLFSKGQAVTLPLCFLLVDYLFRRKVNLKLIGEKIPFFILSVIFGLIAVKAQDSSIIHNGKEIFQTVFWGCYGLCLYLFKFILPINLSGLYPYPMNPDRSMPFFVYASPAIIAILLIPVFVMFRKNRFVIFGLLFFIANIFTLLKFIPIGDAIIADRYSYIPYIGLFFILGYGFNKLINNPNYKPYKEIFQYGGIVLVTILAVLSFFRVMIWKDTFSFWGDAISKDKSYWRPYYCIGQEYYDEGDYNSAIKFFTGGIVNDKYCPPTVYMWRGNTYLEKKHNNDSAIADYKKVLDFGNKQDPSQIDGRLNLGLAYYRKGMYYDALKIYNELLAMAPGETPAYFQRAMVYQYENPPHTQMALDDYNKAIQMDPNNAMAYLNRGSLYVDQLNNYDAGITDFNKTLELDPGNTDAPINKGIAYYKKGDFDGALNIYNAITQKTGDNGRTYYLKALAYAGKKDYATALQNAEQAQKLGLTLDAAILQQWKAKK